MSYHVRVLARARRDFDEIIDYIAERSPEGAARLVMRFEEALARLERNPFVAPFAPESEDLQQEIRQILFSTRSGRTYRALFIVSGDEVRVLRVRGSAQPPVNPEDLRA